MRRLILAVLVLALLAPLVALAHPGHDHKIMGTIAVVDASKIVVKTTDGKETSIQLVATTVFKKGKGKGQPSDLKAGLRVVVNAGSGEEPLKAKEVQYSIPVTTAKK